MSLTRAIQSLTVVCQSLISAIKELIAAIVATQTEDKTRIVFKIGLATEQANPVFPDRQSSNPLKSEILSMSQLPYTHSCTLTAKFLDSKGNTASVDGIPEWMVDNSELLLIKASADGFSCACEAVGPLGIVSVTVRADADTSAGVEHLIGTHEFEITGGKATVVELEASEPVETGVEITPFSGKKK